MNRRILTCLIVTGVTVVTLTHANAQESSKIVAPPAAAGGSEAARTTETVVPSAPASQSSGGNVQDQVEDVEQETSPSDVKLAVPLAGTDADVAHLPRDPGVGEHGADLKGQACCRAERESSWGGSSTAACSGHARGQSLGCRQISLRGLLGSIRLCW